jgi:hypothetical protein
LGNAHALDLKVLFDTYFRKPDRVPPKRDGSHLPSKRDDSPRHTPPLPDTGAGVCHAGLDELRSRYLLEVFTQVTSVVRKKERRKRRLLREARALQRETEEQVAMMREIERIEGEYEGQIRDKVRELRERIELEKRDTGVIVSEEEDEEDSAESGSKET